MSTVEEILEAARTLPPSDRARLVRELAGTLDDTESAGPEVEAAWAEEIGRRHAEVVSGSVKLLSRDDVRKHFEDRYGWK